MVVRDYIKSKADLLSPAHILAMILYTKRVLINIGTPSCGHLTGSYHMHCDNFFGSQQYSDFRFLGSAFHIRSFTCPLVHAPRHAK